MSETAQKLAINTLLTRHKCIAELDWMAADETSCHLELTGMPRLSFFVDLASLYGVPLDDVQVTANSGSSGCDTCGYGSTVEINVEIRGGVVEIARRLP